MSLNKIDDELLEEINGGTQIRYDMEKDPLYRRFSSMKENEREEGGSGMESRAAFLGEIGNWVNGRRATGTAAVGQTSTGTGKKG